MKVKAFTSLVAALLSLKIQTLYGNGCTNVSGLQCVIPNYWLDGGYNCSQWEPFEDRTMSTKDQTDFDGNSFKSWRSVMWFTDDIWSGTLADYQSMLQESFSYAVMDIHETWGKTNMTDLYQEDMSVDDFYVNVTFFLGFCLLSNKDDCDIIAETKLKEYEDDGEIDGDRDAGDYYVYSVIYTTELYEQYLHDLMDRFSMDYMAYSSMRLQCHDFADILNASGSEITEAELKYKGWAFYVEPLETVEPWRVPEYMNYGVLGFVGFCVLFAIAGAIHGFGYWKADCIRISGIIYFGLYTWDFYSDIVFTLSLWECEECGRTLFYAGAAFVVVPWIANMIALSRYQNKWCKDETIRERVYQWFVSWQRLTYALAALSGSAFGTVELANSYVFGLDFFCMGLNERHLKKFNNNRLYSSILVENAPQICIQLIYFSRVGWDEMLDPSGDGQLALMALCASTLSVGAALLDIYASKKLFSVLKQDGEYVGKTSCSIFVISPEIKQNATRLQVSTYAFREAIAETLSTHPRSVEMHFPIATSTGFKMKFTVFSSKLTPTVIHKALKQGSESKLPKRIQQQWRLVKEVKIPLDRIDVEKVDNDNGEGEGFGLNNANQNAMANAITNASQSQSQLDPNAAPVQSTVEIPDALPTTKATEGI